MIYMIHSKQITLWMGLWIIDSTDSLKKDESLKYHCDFFIGRTEQKQ